MSARAILLFTLLMSIAFSGFACDEACQKQKAEQSKNIKFASYLSWDFCDDTRMEFMTSAISSLENYSSEHFDTRYKGGMRNIKNFISARKEWLQECDQYLKLTGKGYVFDDEKTTTAIFKAMESINTELSGFIAGATYSGTDASEIMKNKFEDLFTKVDDHKTLMHLRGKYVYR